MSNGPPPPYPPPALQQSKKGLPPLAWAGIGCGGFAVLFLTVVVILAMKAGKAVMKALNEHPAKETVEAVFRDYPTLEKTAEDPVAGTFNLRVKSSGKEVPRTTYADWLHGKVMIEDTTGASVPALQGDVSKVPAWVPRYPGTTGEVSLLHQESPTRIHGILVADTSDSKEAVSSFFEAESKKISGLSSSGSSNTDMNGRRSVSMSFSGGKYRLEIHAYGMPGGPMTVVTIYTEEK
jgi:hypothetical protein